MKEEEKNSDSKTSRVNIEVALSAVKKKLEEVNPDLERENDEVSVLERAANSLKSLLEKEKTELATIEEKRLKRDDEPSLKVQQLRALNCLRSFGI